jgi:hypothetical protein
VEKTRVVRHTCQHCHCHRAVFIFRGHWRARRDHDLCPRCFRALMDSLQAKALAR